MKFEAGIEWMAFAMMLACVLTLVLIPICTWLDNHKPKPRRCKDCKWCGDKYSDGTDYYCDRGVQPCGWHCKGKDGIYRGYKRKWWKLGRAK